MIIVDTINREGKSRNESIVSINRKKTANSFQQRILKRRKPNYQIVRTKFLKLTIQAEQMNINPFADERGMPILGREIDFFDWEKRKAEKKFSALPIEKQFELRKTSERFAKKMDS